MKSKNHSFFPFLIGFCWLFIAVSCEEMPRKNQITDESNLSETPISTSKTIAFDSADTTDTFTPIPKLESYLETPIFGKDFKVIIESPKQDFRHPLQNNQFMLRVKGQVETITKEVPTDFKLRLFSNNLTDFQANKPMDEWDISFKNETNSYQFKHSSILNFNPGIYYFTIEQTSTKERFYVGKITLL